MQYNEIQEMFQEMIQFIPQIEMKLLASGLTLFFTWIIRKIIDEVTRRHYEDVRTRYQVRKTSSYIITGFAFFIITWIWFDGFTSVATFFGLVSAGLAIALRDMLIDLAGWIFIIWRQPFKVGDRIQIGDLAGDVIDIREFQFTLLEIGNWVAADQSTGRMIHVPNGKVFRDAQANYTQSFEYIWDEIAVTITFESNWEEAKRLLERIALQHVGHLCMRAEEQVRQAAGRYMIFYSKFTPIVYTSLSDYGIVLTLRYMIEPRRRRGNRQAIYEDMLRSFARASDIVLAYPTQRWYNSAAEGPVRPYTRPEADRQGGQLAGENGRETSG